MSNPLVKELARPKTQTEKVRKDQVKNNAGGYVFTVSDKDRLTRFLIMGTYGTYYQGQREVTQENIAFLRKMLAADEVTYLAEVEDVSVKGRAYKNSPAIFAAVLALCEGEDKQAAKELFAKVVRTSTHLFEACEYIKQLGGWGRAKRSVVANFYESKSEQNLAYQLVKYRSRKV